MRLSVPLTAAILLIAAPATAQASDEERYAALSRQIDVATKGLMGDPAKALQLADRALASARALPDTRRARLAIATAQWLDAEAHLGLNHVKVAAPLANAALATAVALAPDTKLHGDLLRTKGAIAATEGRIPQALSAFQDAYRVFTAARLPRSQAIALQDLGQLFDSAGDYTRALGYYAQAIEAYRKDPALLVANYNNRAEGLRKLHRSAEAEVEYKRALEQARLIGSDVLELRILCNLADIQAQRSAFPAAAASLARAQRLARGSEAAGWQPFVLGTEAKVAVAARDYATAGALFDRMFAGIDLGTTDQSYLEFHQAASVAYDRTGQPQRALAHLRAYQRLNDDARDVAASAGAQLAASRFDFANQNLRISNLKARQLTQQVQLERQHSRIRTLTTGGLLALAALAVAFLSVMLVTGRRSRNRLRAVNTDLERALKAKTDFLAMTSHEIRTPLNGILGMTQVMLTERDLRADLRDRIRLVQGAGETMRALVDDILDVAKMETGAIEVIEQDVDVAALVGEIAALWRDQANAKGVALSENVCLPPQVRTDAARLRQVMFNLLSNAVKFTGRGAIVVRARAVNDTLTIAVEDTGIGIDAAQLESIFEPFHQADAATTRQYGGTGLGLAICRKVSAALGGTISVVSELGAGSTFTITLPLVVGDVVTDETRVARSPATDLASARVLLLDANLLAQAMLQSLLEAVSAGVEVASTRAEAEAILSRGAIDHLVLDAGSVVSDPADLSAVLQAAQSAGARTSVLVPASGPHSVNEVEAAGADQAIAKPVAGSMLIARMKLLYVNEFSDAEPARLAHA